MRRSTTCTTSPRSAITPSTHSGTLGTAVMSRSRTISRTRDCSTSSPCWVDTTTEVARTGRPFS